jgi:alkanesulfonate monooxygenase SsuD/methylene tetrahydromethanopterin reductase-like flavin-dependent oxidoreductase (luciferase family)
MKFGISIPPFAAPAEMVELAGRADSNGWDGVFVWDHVHFIRELRLPVHDPWVLLGAIAQATTRVRLGTMVTPLARRRPAVVAKHVVTLDHLSGGRATLGIGLGSPDEDEFAMFGEDANLARRGDRVDEALEVITGLWSAEPFTFRGDHFSIDAELHPAPVQSPRPPIWAAVMSNNGRPRRRALRVDGVVPLGENALLAPDELRAFVDRLGPTPAGWDVVASWKEGHRIAEWEAAGATWLVVGRWPVDNWLQELMEVACSPPSD